MIRTPVLLHKPAGLCATRAALATQELEAAAAPLMRGAFATLLCILAICSLKVLARDGAPSNTEACIADGRFGYVDTAAAAVTGQDIQQPAMEIQHEHDMAVSSLALDAAPAQGDEPLSLPAASPGAVQSLELGSKIPLDHLGPAIVGEDGTLRRIANWDRLSDQEKKVAWRRIAARNNQRLAVLRAQEDAAGGAQDHTALRRADAASEQQTQ